MKTIRLRWAEINNVRTVARARLEFPERGLVLLRGPSGVGKSSLLQGISWALGASTATETRMRRHGADDVQVDVGISIDGQEQTVRRGATSSFGGFTGAKASKEALRVALGVPDLQALTYRAQKSRGTFLSLSDEEKKGFLVQAVPDLRKYEAAAERALESARVAAAWATELAGALQAAEHRLNDEPELEALPDPQVGLEPLREAVRRCNRQVRERQVKVDLAEATLRELSLKVVPEDPEKLLLEGEISACREKLVEMAATTTAWVRDVHAQHRAHDAAARKLADAAAQARSDKVGNWQLVLDLQRRHASQTAALRQPVPECHECHQPLPQPQHDAAVAKTEATAAALDKAERAQECLDRSAVNAEHALAAHGGFQEPADPLADDRAAICAALAEREQRFRDFRNPARQEHSAEVGRAQEHRDNCATSLHLEREALGAATQALRLAEQRVAFKAESHEAAQKRRAAALAVRDRADAEFRAAHSAEVEASDLALVLGRQGFLGAIFDEILATVSSAVSDALLASPNTSRKTFRLVSQTETKAGKAQRRISAEIRENGEPDDPSGGQESIIDLAVDLALGEELRRRSGVDPAWIFLDEPFDGCGPQDVEAMLEVLRRSAQDRLIVVVDHLTETREWFDVVYEVDAGPDGAQVRVVA